MKSRPVFRNSAVNCCQQPLAHIQTDHGLNISEFLAHRPNRKVMPSNLFLVSKLECHMWTQAVDNSACGYILLLASESSIKTVEPLAKFPLNFRFCVTQSSIARPQA